MHTAADGGSITAAQPEPSASLDRQAACIAAWLRANDWTVEPFADTERGSRIARVIADRITGRAAR